MRGVRLAERGAIVERDDRAGEEEREQIVEPPAAAVRPREIHRCRFTIINGRCRAPRRPRRVPNGLEIAKERFRHSRARPGLAEDRAVTLQWPPTGPVLDDLYEREAPSSDLRDHEAGRNAVAGPTQGLFR